jgi:two-component system sensor histidine kinase RpfC
LGNAIKFTPAGEVRLHVAISSQAAADSQRLRFTVSDTGIGIPASARAKLFEAFEQADNSLARKFGGTGLGTTIAKGLTEAMGGSIGFESNENAGSRFWVELPFGLPSSVSPAAAVATPKSAGDTLVADAASGAVPAGGHANVIAFADPFLRHRARVRPLRALIADDHAANRMVLQGVLQKAGHRVFVADDGETALDALAAGEFDLALVDLHMPVLDGVGLMRQLRVMEAGSQRRTPVVVLSADATPEAVQACTNAGARAFLTKPFALARLLDVIADIAAGTTTLPLVEGARAHANANAPAAGDILDPAVLDEFAALGMGAEFEAEFIGQCVADARVAVQRLRAAAATADWEQLREQAHALKGIAGNMGLVQLAAHSGLLMRLTGLELGRDWSRHADTLAERLRVGEQALAARGRWQPAREEQR